MPILQVNKTDYEVSAFGEYSRWSQTDLRGRGHALQVVASILKIGKNARHEISWGEFVDVSYDYPPTVWHAKDHVLAHVKPRV